jgi:hypothetical protein
VPPILNAGAVITCPHQTGVVIVTPTQAQVVIGGAPALRATDCTSWAIAPGCTQLPTPATPTFVPCAKVVSILGVGASAKVMIQGVPALLQTAQFMTNGIPVPTPATVKFPGQVQVSATA